MTPTRPERPTDNRSAFLTELVDRRPRAPSRLSKTDENRDVDVGDGNDDSGLRPAEKPLAPSPPPTTTGRRASVRADSRRRSTLRAADATDNGRAAPTTAEPARSLRSLMHKAAQRTVLVVRSKSAMQSAEGVTIRFSASTPTELPRAVQLPQIIDKVLGHVATQVNACCASRLASEADAAPPTPPPLGLRSRRHLREFREAFQAAPEVDALLKDLFWLSTARLFQSGRHADMEPQLLARVADSFTALFARLQLPPAPQTRPDRQHQSVHARDRQTRAARRFLDALPGVMAQVLFLCLYEAFPRSREALQRRDTQTAVRRACTGWLSAAIGREHEGGDDDGDGEAFVHWLSAGNEAPKRIAALAEFPAMRNRMLRAERVERSKLATRDRHAAAVAMTSASCATLPAQPEPRPSAAGDALGLRAETRERRAVEMLNSPLVAAFLDNHAIAAGAGRLRVRLRLTSSSSSSKSRPSSVSEGDQSGRPWTTPPADAVAGLQALRTVPHAPREHRRCVADPAGFMLALAHIQREGDIVRGADADARQAARAGDALDRQRLAAAHRALDGQFSALRRRGARLHEFSNQLVSKRCIDAMLGVSAASNSVGTGGGPAAGTARPSTTPRAS